MIPEHRYTVATLARYLGVSARTVERWWSSGLLPEPVERLADGTKLWSAQQARVALRRRMEDPRLKIERQVRT